MSWLKIKEIIPPSAFQLESSLELLWLFHLVHFKPCSLMQSETTLWRLKFFVREALERQANAASGKMDENAKRKREICNALAKTASKRIKKQP